MALSLCVSAHAGDSTADARPVTVVLRSDGAEPTFAAVQSAVADELGVPAVAADSEASSAARGVLTVTYRAATKELAISYSDAARGTVTRIVPATEHSADVPGVAALVAGNLVRNQAAELLNQTEPALIAPPAPIPPPPAPAPAATALPLAPRAPPPVHWLANASFFYPLSTNLNEPELETNFDFNLLYGHIGRLNGIELGTVSTVSTDAQGLQISLLTNLVGGRVSAGQFSFGYNRGRSLEGVQLALVNRADESMQGLQLGGFNMAGSLSKGVQLSALNFSGDFEGLQVGLVNIGKHVKGLQVGLINIADDMDGIPIGLVSVSHEGGVHPVVWSSNTTCGNVAVKFATRYTAECPRKTQPLTLVAAPDERLAREQLGEALFRALDELSLDHRVAFVLCVVEERPSHEAAELIGAPAATVRARSQSAQKVLRALLEQGGFR